MMHPTKLMSWCLSDFAAKIDIEYSKQKMTDIKENETIMDPDHVENLTYHNGEDSFPIEMRNGITLKLRKKTKLSILETIGVCRRILQRKTHVVYSLGKRK